MEIKEVKSVELKDLFYPCGPDEGEFVQAKDHFQNLWRDDRLKRGWRGFVAYDEGKAVGRAEIWPIEESFYLLSGKNLYFMPCIWVLREHQKKGIGKALLEKVIEITKDRDGLLTQGTDYDFWMPLSFFKKFGFKETGLSTAFIKFVIKKYNENIEPLTKLSPSFEHKKRDDKVVVEIVKHATCPFMKVWEQKLKKVLENYKDKLEIIEYEVKTREDGLKYGFDTVYVDSEEPFSMPEDEEKIREILEGYLKKKNLF